MEELNQEIISKINQRRRQMVVHSIIYYKHGESIITDKQFDSFAYELVRLQKQHPKESQAAILYDEFQDWDGTTGYHICGIPGFHHVVHRLLNYNKNKE